MSLADSGCKVENTEKLQLDFALYATHADIRSFLDLFVKNYIHYLPRTCLDLFINYQKPSLID